MLPARHLPAGYSDHSEGIVIPIAAVARGAVIIEKHFTLDKNLDGPDHKASLEPQELSAMVGAIRQVNIALGGKVKMPTASEIKNVTVARKSIVAAAEILAGEPFTEINLAVKRPGYGISPYQYWSMLKRNANRNYKAGDLIVE